MYYDDSYRNPGRFSLSSIVLLVIFVSAFALILAAIIWRPWTGDDKATTAPVAAEQTAAAAAGEVAPADGAQPAVVTGP